MLIERAKKSYRVYGKHSPRFFDLAHLDAHESELDNFIRWINEEHENVQKRIKVSTDCCRSSCNAIDSLFGL